MPDFALPDQHGVVRPLSHYLAEGPVLLNVYRGGWCPYCNMEMQALNAVLPALRERGVNLIGMTPETPSSAQDTLTANGLAITVLSDEGNRVSAALGLVFELPEALRPIYAGFGIDIPASNGDESFTLPVPASYIIGQTAPCTTTSSTPITPVGSSRPPCLPSWIVWRRRGHCKRTLRPKAQCRWLARRP